MIKGIIDSHAHYDDERFKDDRDAVLKAARSSGVEQIINIGVDIATSKKSLGLAGQYPYIYATVGIHPLEAGNAPEDFCENLKKLAMQPKVMAIGEIGLDYHYDGYSKKTQHEVFRSQLRLAEELSLPVVIHSRDACEDTLKILSEYSGTGVIHCFSGSAQTAKKLVSMGFYIGFTGVVTYSNARKTVEAALAVPMDRLLVETDCPYLPPVPHRGKRCSSDMLHLTVERLAEIKNVLPQKLADITAENARRLFKLPAAV